MLYQFFGSPPIAFGMRIDNRLHAHEHLVKQHFFPRDVHTLDRKDAIVTALLDPGTFTEPFAIASRPLDDAAPDQSKAYEHLIDQLNAQTVSAALTQAFAEHDFTLTPRPKVTVVTWSTNWQVTDEYPHEGTTYEIHRRWYERLEGLQLEPAEADALRSRPVDRKGQRECVASDPGVSVERGKRDPCG